KAYYSELTEKYGYFVEIPVTVLSNLGNDRLRKNLFNEAIEVFKHNVNLYPNEARAHVYLGLAYEIKGETALAVKHIKKAVEIDPSWTWVKTKL
ncbi:tetratricopeptide repeat protein, partial [Acidobacteriota bacterium]